MPVVSLRIADDALHRRLKEASDAAGVSISALSERLIDEGLRMSAHPGVTFRSGPAGRRPALIGGPDVAEVIGALVGGDVPAEDRRLRTAELLVITPAQVDAALAYYTDFTDEVEADLQRRSRLAEEHEAAWLRQEALLAR